MRKGREGAREGLPHGATKFLPPYPLSQNGSQMRLFHRVVATTVAGLALAAAGVVGAAPALATPEDGEGCAGSPDLPATYVCVISVTPETVLPGVTTTNVPVTVPRLCYVAGCTAATTVDVPVPGVTPRSGVVVTLWYNGSYIPIGVGTVDAIGILFDTIDLATEVANDGIETANGVVAYAAQLADGAVATALGLAGAVVDIVNQEIDDAWVVVGDTVEDVNRIVENLPTIDELLTAIFEEIQERLAPYQDEIDRINEYLNDPGALIQQLLDSPLVRRVLDLIDDADIPCVDYACISLN